MPNVKNINEPKTKMTYEEIQTQLSLLIRGMSDKGCIRPTAVLHIKGNEEPQIWLANASSGAQVGSYQCHIVNADTPQGALDAAFLHISEMPEPEVAIAQEYARKLAQAVDYGRENGVDSDYVDPVSGMIQKISKNLLGHDEVLDNYDMDNVDNMPF